jgi:hypothetical protein
VQPLKKPAEGKHSQHAKAGGIEQEDAPGADQRFGCEGGFGLLADKAAVQAGLTLCWSPGQKDDGQLPFI